MTYYSEFDPHAVQAAESRDMAHPKSRPSSSPLTWNLTTYVKRHAGLMQTTGRHDPVSRRHDLDA